MTVPSISSQSSAVSRKDAATSRSSSSPSFSPTVKTVQVGLAKPFTASTGISRSARSYSFPISLMLLALFLPQAYADSSSEYDCETMRGTRSTTIAMLSMACIALLIALYNKSKARSESQGRPSESQVRPIVNVDNEVHDINHNEIRWLVESVIERQRKKTFPAFKVGAEINLYFTNRIKKILYDIAAGTMKISLKTSETASETDRDDSNTKEQIISELARLASINWHRLIKRIHKENEMTMMVRIMENMKQTSQQQPTNHSSGALTAAENPPESPISLSESIQSQQQPTNYSSSVLTAAENPPESSISLSESIQSQQQPINHSSSALTAAENPPESSINAPPELFINQYLDKLIDRMINSAIEKQASKGVWFQRFTEYAKIDSLSFDIRNELQLLRKIMLDIDDKIIKKAVIMIVEQRTRQQSTAAPPTRAYHDENTPPHVYQILHRVRQTAARTIVSYFLDLGIDSHNLQAQAAPPNRRDRPVFPAISGYSTLIDLEQQGTTASTSAEQAGSSDIPRERYEEMTYDNPTFEHDEHIAKL